MITTFPALAPFLYMFLFRINSLLTIFQNPFSIEPVCTYLRTYIPDIGHTDGCSQSSGWFGELNFVGGQLFDSDNYNIIVGSVVDSDEC